LKTAKITKGDIARITLTVVEGRDCKMKHNGGLRIYTPQSDVGP